MCCFSEILSDCISPVCSFVISCAVAHPIFLSEAGKSGCVLSAIVRMLILLLYIIRKTITFVALAIVSIGKEHEREMNKTRNVCPI